MKNKSAAHVAQAIEQFNTALMQLQVYQAPRLKLYKDNWDEQVLQAQQKLADISKLYNHVQKKLDRNDIVDKVPNRAKAANALLVAASSGAIASADMTNLMSINRMSNFGISYQKMLASLGASIDEVQLAARTIMPAHFVGTSYFTPSNIRPYVKLLMACMLSFVLACLVVGLVELMRSRD